MEGVDKFITL